MPIFFAIVPDFTKFSSLNNIEKLVYIFDDIPENIVLYELPETNLSGQLDQNYELIYNNYYFKLKQLNS